ncbi:hypothetical protein LTR56_000817 [Elasticomyces elasticus]|nr:hypothetical protein LTR22_009025 [Elasticomyces elasticus]KAK3660441.1 hypothetical protein LTR56_000817 [Elasticomyces elasticus]KAK4929166.1 hypothetical protein LTR49_004063 [Elasticomyces elasticus]KAK5765721.1 hypothetical protein LTS12_003981 [Elasticomyces elasticus]
MDISDNVRQAVQAQQDYDLAEAVSTKEEIAKIRFERKLKTAIRQQSCRIEMLRKSDQDKLDVELDELEKEVKKLQMLLAETTAGLMELRTRLSSEACNLRWTQARLIKSLERAFVCAQLVEPPVQRVVPEVPELEIEEEYERLCKAYAEHKGVEIDWASAPPSPRSCNEELDDVELSPEEQHHQDLINAFYAADFQLQVAEYALYGKDKQHATGLASYGDAVGRVAKTSDESQEAFDLAQEITHNLAIAEEAFAAAKAAIVETGLTVESHDGGYVFSGLGANVSTKQSESETQLPTKPIDASIRPEADLRGAASNQQESYAKGHHVYGDSRDDSFARSLAVENLEPRVRDTECKEQPDGAAEDLPPGDFWQAMSQMQDREDQAAREKSYVCIDGDEDPMDYTEGPSRLVMAADGLKPCVALLMTTGLSDRVQAAVQARRDIDSAQVVVPLEREVNIRYQLNVECALDQYSTRIAELTAINTGEPVAELTELQNKVEKLQYMLDEARYRDTVLDTRLNTTAENFCRCQNALTLYMEESFIDGTIIEPEVGQGIPEIPEFDLDEEYIRLCRSTKEDQGLEMASALSLASCQDDLQLRKLSPEEQHRQDLIDAAYTARQQYNLAQAAFDRRDYDRRVNKQNAASEAGIDEGEFDATPEGEEFQLCWFKLNNELTHTLVQAEQELAAANRALAEVGVEFDDANSCFVDFGSNGHSMNFEADMKSSTSRPRVESWLDSIVYEVSPEVDVETDVDVDVWNAHDVQIGDSLSCFAYEPARRRRVREWRQQCGL